MSSFKKSIGLESGWYTSQFQRTLPPLTKTCAVWDTRVPNQQQFIQGFWVSTCFQHVSTHSRTTLRQLGSHAVLFFAFSLALILCQRVMIFFQISFRIPRESNEHPHLPGISGPWKPPPESMILRGCYPRLSPLQPFKKWEAVPTDVLAGENGWLLTPAIREPWSNHIRITVSMSLIQFNHI